MSGLLATYKELLTRPTLRRVLVAYFISETGDGVTYVALPLFILATGGSATTVGVALAANVFASAAAGSLGGSLADRLDRRLLVVVSFVLRAPLLTVCALSTSIPLTIAAATVAAALGAVDNPAMESAVLENARGDVERTSALRNIGYAGAWALGPAVAGVIVSLSTPQVAFALDAVSFVFGALIIGTTRGFDPASRWRRARVKVTAHQSLTKRRSAGGFGTIWHTPDVRRYVSYSVLGMIGVSIVLVALPTYLVDTLADGDLAYGLASSSYAVGVAASLLYYGTKKFRKVRLALLLTALAYGVSTVGVALIPALIPIVILRLLWGWAFGPDQIVGDVLLVGATPSQVLGRMFAAYTVLIRSGSFIGALLAGPIVASLGPRLALIVSGVLFILLGVAFFGRRAGVEAGVSYNPDPANVRTTP